ncbi:adenylyl-sulfate kinase [Planktosalinus lacus]|uniref:Adenylyl-sulfate kinase n=1 Tax=Planktosalinus lacus TaxID=1526573 RepID=A0A8J2Y712_9FLAO|nr:adenylyl-sulfate kinase [Planktosalinus lacus]GGD85000.1 adenylyl-sulfate kinase [Planktosalinus lacus]
MDSNITPHQFSITREDRAYSHQHPAFVLWFTGLSGSGKSTIANAVEKALFEKGMHTYSLDGDNIRGGINKGLGFSEADRTENLRRIAEVAKLFVDAGIITLAAFISPTHKDRAQVRNIIGETDFFEIYVDTPLHICEQRDPKGLYKKARAGEIKNFTGIDAPYEAPLQPDLILKTEEEPVPELVKKVLTFVQSLIEKK